VMPTLSSSESSAWAATPPRLWPPEPQQPRLPDAADFEPALLLLQPHPPWSLHDWSAVLETYARAKNTHTRRVSGPHRQKGHADCAFTCRAVRSNSDTLSSPRLACATAASTTRARVCRWAPGARAGAATRVSRRRRAM
jgi:hypothetical protein